MSLHTTSIPNRQVHIAIPEPTSLDFDYNLRSLAPYLFALQAAGAIPIVIPLHERPERVAKVLSTVQGILLPGSKYDVDPERYGDERSTLCSESDPARTAVDELLMQDAFNLYKPILAICGGLQGLNVWLNGTLVQHLETAVNHQPGREVKDAHPIRLRDRSRLFALSHAEEASEAEILVNSSHHQAIGRVGDNLLVSAVSPLDGVIEAVELETDEHFVMGVQWHPERTYITSGLSRALFANFVYAAEQWVPRRIEESVASRSPE